MNFLLQKGLMVILTDVWILCGLQCVFNCHPFRFFNVILSVTKDPATPKALCRFNETNMDSSATPQNDVEKVSQSNVEKCLRVTLKKCRMMCLFFIDLLTKVVI